MNLVIDIGNTLLKYAVFEEKEIIYGGTSESIDEFSVESIFLRYSEIKNAIVSSVRIIPENLIATIKSFCKLHLVSNKTKLPFVNLYKTPGTLGNDRIAGILGAFSLYPKKNVLVIDAGTCITTDFLHADGKYYGGTISPGIKMKLTALHTFTEKLPLVNLRDLKNDYGYDTETSIITGVINGTVAEIEYIIDYYKKKYKEIIVLLCGGDAAFLAKRLKNSIFAVSELVLIGLNELLEYNEE